MANDRLQGIFEPEKWKYRLVPIWYRRLMTVEQCRLLHNLEQRRARSDRRYRRAKQELRERRQVGGKDWTETMQEIGRRCREYSLTEKETALVASIAVGLTQREIATALSISMRRLRRLLQSIRETASNENESRTVR